MKIVWIGAGNLASQLAPALGRAGHEALQVFSRTMASAGALAARLGCPATDDPDAVARGADAYVFSVTDGALEGLAARVAPRAGDALCLHTAGSMPQDVFRGHASRYGVFYPMQTFSKGRTVDFKEIPVFVEASCPDALAETERLARSVSDRVEVMGTEKRRRLHLAAVFACNFANHCYALAERLLNREGIPFDVMWPLVEETARKVRHLSPAEAQTGPAVRRDRNVSDLHLALLGGDPETKALYEAMSRSIRRLASERPGTGRSRPGEERKETYD